MLRTNRVLIASAFAAVLGWIVAGAATVWVVLNPTLHYAPVYLLWVHSFAVVATMNTVVLVTVRTFRCMLGDIRQAYAIGLEHGIDIRDSIEVPGQDSLGDSAPSSIGTQKASATAGASPMTV